MLAQPPKKSAQATTAIKMWRYFIAGIFNTIIGHLVIFLLYFFSTPEVIASLLGYLVGLTLSFFLSKMYVFEAQEKSRVFIKRFLFAFLFCFLVNIAVLKTCMFYGVNFYVSQIAGSFCYFACFFVLKKNFVFVNEGKI